jgi:radical SAM superfamily enzyme YgiQ (UPF0313 family)
MDRSRNPRVWLCDLTYTQQTISSDVMPAAIGHIAAYTEKFLEAAVDIRIFKFPEKLAAALTNDPPPDCIGFSNYIWNCDLSCEFARVIKLKRPRVVTIMGGPNYPTRPAEQEDFLASHPMIDFYITKEGERAFAKLVQALVAVGFDCEKVPHDLPSVHRISQGRFLAPKSEDRIFDLQEIPSPYLTGLMDEYFDGVMLPIIQTNRGCPFRCTFCVEGESYYSRVAKTRNDKTVRELEYIAERMAALRSAGKGRSDLHIADSNFGMYKEDLEVCRHIADLQRRFGYPEYINVATGKNHKERVLEAARLINGALRLSGSVQSLDKEVLRNIDRSNIDESEIMDLALAASDIGANSYSEIILGLPGDTVDAHLTTIRKIVEADFNTVALYQLMLLPGTDLASRESIDKWKMCTRYRVLPRCFGHWDVLGEQINAAEIEEVCIANSSMTFSDYLACRRFHLIINLFFNDGVFKEVLRLLKMLGLSKYEWLRRLWEHRGNKEFDSLVEGFLRETKEELWEDFSELRALTRKRESTRRYISGEYGANLIFKYKSLGLVRHVACLAELAEETLTDFLLSAGVSAKAVRLGTELIEFARLRMTDIFENHERVHRGRFTFDAVRFAQAVRPAEIAEYEFDEPVEYEFHQSSDQIRQVAEFTTIYGSSNVGLSRILSKVYVRRLFRHANPVNAESMDVLSRKEVILGDGQLTGLNEFS